MSGTDFPTAAWAAAATGARELEMQQQRLKVAKSHINLEIKGAVKDGKSTVRITDTLYKLDAGQLLDIVLELRKAGFSVVEDPINHMWESLRGITISWGKSKAL